ncbi:SDR family oxidoreductase [Brochothrix thermosphacta]|uniref:SDR family oxidoreductase n=1 Tax=Brochothrix thermosphacta TaxID=2756 RepID=UPI00083FB292|nr:SDR family oxidoreductase [Brochothrix thermosphacta]ODJ62781.1 oxidoreductase [Brochothrix thermosphacta]ODJ65428.1 oxidoreductase [Brochothrix thermosphacta]SPN71858.1 putative short-chain dehydrogenase/reductase, NAD(P) dependent [Brochothrix thermosphacta]
MNNAIKDKVVVITGASSGIGEATAKLLIENGAKVVLGARREGRLKELVKKLGDNSAYAVTDVRNAKEIEMLVQVAKEKFGKVDVLFANAGIMPASNMSELKTAEWNDMVDINIKGVLNSLAAILPEFKTHKAGQVITTSSIAGLKIFPGNSVYTGTKHAVRAIMEGFRMESAMEGTNIRTTTLSPGAIDTELLEIISTPEVKSEMEQFYKVAITPDAVAKTVLFAISQPESVAITEMTILPSKQA